MRRSVLIGLIVCNAIWSANPIAAKILLRQHSPLEIAWLRSASTLVTAWLLLISLQRLKRAEVSPIENSLRKKNLGWIAALGLISFFGSFVLHVTGLSATTATANALIIALEPLIATTLAWIVLRERIGTAEGIAFLLAFGGFLLLSQLSPQALLDGGIALNPGNLILLASLFTDSTFSIISRRLAGKVAPVSTFAHALPFGFLPLTVYAFTQGVSFSAFTSFSPEEWLALLWFGPIGTAITWTYWGVALRSISVASASLTLFAQPILGAAAGYFFLHERLGLFQWSGAALILAALLVQTKETIRRSK